VDKESGNAYAEPGVVITGHESAREWGDGGWRGYVVVQAAVLVIEDDEQGLGEEIACSR
jgi:hypothetical protein